ncbi:unnamed protein product [Peronospora effusa]|nr:unnamed protein product [Peronospora effusa]
MVAEDNISGTYGHTVNRVGGLVAGTVVPSVFSFFSMYVWFCGRYMALAGMTSAFMAASVLLDHGCRNTSSSTVSRKPHSECPRHSHPDDCGTCDLPSRSSRGLLRSNIQHLLTQYSRVFCDVFRHHIAHNRPVRISTGPLTEEDIETANALLNRTQIKALRFQMKAAIPELLKTQANLLDGSTMETTLWKPPFSTSKYTKVLGVCRELLDRIYVFADLIDWHENRRSSGKDIL